MQTANAEPSAKGSGRVARTFWAIGWSLLLIASACVSYALLIIVGK